jgi:hypothetical protein
MGSDVDDDHSIKLIETTPEPLDKVDAVDDPTEGKGDGPEREETEDHGQPIGHQHYARMGMKVGMPGMHPNGHLNLITSSILLLAMAMAMAME